MNGLGHNEKGVFNTKNEKAMNSNVTILVVYTDHYLNETCGYKKRYAFNVEAGTVSVGDLLNSPNYNNYMQVVKVLDKAYTYVNRSNGELKDEITNTNDFQIRKLNIVEGGEREVITATRMNEL